MSGASNGDGTPLTLVIRFRFDLFAFAYEPLVTTLTGSSAKTILSRFRRASSTGSCL